MSDTLELSMGPVPRPMETAPKDHTWVRLLVDYSAADLDARPLEDSASPSWTIGSNGEDHTGVPGWTFVGWNWSQDCIVETTAGVPIGWLPFHHESDEDLRDQIVRLEIRLKELDGLINSPETEDWLKGARLEAVHQVERWGAAHDVGKTCWDWFWLIGYLAQKAAASQAAGDFVKAKHHTISTAAALLNWHRNLSGADDRMRPGVDSVERGFGS